MALMLDIGYQGHWESHPRLRNNVTGPLDATETKITIVVNLNRRIVFIHTIASSTSLLSKLYQYQYLKSCICRHSDIGRIAPMKYEASSLSNKIKQ